MQTKTFGAWGGFFVSIAAGALTQASDYQFLALPVAILFGTFFLVLVGMFIFSNRREIRRIAKLIEPLHLIVLGLVVAAAGAVWQSYRASPDQRGAELATPVTELDQNHAAATSSDSSGMSAETAKKIARYWKLEEAIPKAKQIRDRINETGDVYLKNLRASGRPYDSVGWVNRWQSASGEIVPLSASIFNDSPVDLDKPLDLHMPAPGEAEFGEQDLKARTSYRTSFFRKESVVQQTDQFISRMEKEAEALRAHIVKSAPSAQLDP